MQEVKGVRFRAMKNPQTPNVSVVLWEFPDNEAMKKIEKLIWENKVDEKVKTTLMEGEKPYSYNHTFDHYGYA